MGLLFFPSSSDFLPNPSIFFSFSLCQIGGFKESVFRDFVGEEEVEEGPAQRKFGVGKENCGGRERVRFVGGVVF
jgi:hypothetical protein